VRLHGTVAAQVPAGSEERELTLVCRAACEEGRLKEGQDTAGSVMRVLSKGLGLPCGRAQLPFATAYPSETARCRCCKRFNNAVTPVVAMVRALPAIMNKVGLANRERGIWIMASKFESAVATWRSTANPLRILTAVSQRQRQDIVILASKSHVRFSDPQLHEVSRSISPRSEKSESMN